MIIDIYDMTLKLITPSETGSNFDFSSRQQDILEAVISFNEKFRTWSKRMIVYMISKKAIHLLLIMEKEKDRDHITAREIRYFTTYLNNQKHWSEYSRNISKLFECVNLSSISPETAKRRTDNIDPDSDLFILQGEEIEFLNEEQEKISVKHLKKDIKGISDENIPAIVKYLIETKELGDRSADKKETLSKIKTLLKEWV